MKTLLISLLAGSSASAGVAGAFSLNSLLGVATLGALLGSTALALGLTARNAPVGWEDADGFHAARKRSRNNPRSLGERSRSASANWMGFTAGA